jgi:hypothetical protein
MLGTQFGVDNNLEFHHLQVDRGRFEALIVFSTRNQKTLGEPESAFDLVSSAFCSLTYFSTLSIAFIWRSCDGCA